MLEIKTIFKKGALIISLGGELVEGTIKDLDNIVDLFENDGFSNVIIESRVKCDEKGIKRLEQIKKMNNVIFI